MEYFRGLVIRRVGALPVVAAFAERLGLVDAVDRHCPIRSVADYTHGQVLLAMVANRLTHPQPLSSFVGWGQRFAVEAALGIEADKLNDDRLGRTLDVLADNVDDVLNLVSRRAIERFGIDVSELHWDLTNLLFTGGYEHQDPGHPQVRLGRYQGRQVERQVKAGLLVTGDGAVPVASAAFNGNTGDVVTVEAALDRLDAFRDLAPGGVRPLVVGDSKLFSHSNATAMIERDVRFVPTPEGRCGQTHARCARRIRLRGPVVSPAAPENRRGPVPVHRPSGHDRRDGATRGVRTQPR